MRGELLHCFSDESKGPLGHPTRVKKNDGTKNGATKRDQKPVSCFRFCQVAWEEASLEIHKTWVQIWWRIFSLEYLIKAIGFLHFKIVLNSSMKLLSASLCTELVE